MIGGEIKLDEYLESLMDEEQEALIEEMQEKMDEEEKSGERHIHRIVFFLNRYAGASLL